ncbi:L-tyrosine/L-tryptophan isonitrile synthase family protein [Amycolatopsis saalfeldensis]|uniref:Pyoverdine/dityrosine biosynthesis protein Dit1 n=1 Tax=Amycolatopsis saalfeldensis TaxID=394193 RepID=A0A1H8YLM0_9PSEU|nr:isocyanide synthase family protein [Amycolatopsis saalfeldensis]SEP53104.1 Pyoverdine/dityrosine biosynthesis protein Dit1 [Amycolatopsis saalfeldensis]
MLCPARSAQRIAEDVLRLLLPHRRGPFADEPPAAFAPQLGQLGGFIGTDRPILFTLPGFPCKSPNPAKVLGRLPDEGERLALRFLDGLCERVRQVHPPGARLLICSDGHVFGDLIGVPDEHIDAYAAEIRAIITRERLGNLTTFDLRDVFGELSCAEKRRRVDELYAPALTELRAQVHSDDHMRRLYRGVTKFLFEDSAGFDGSRSALQRSCRVRAYGVLRRSTAWGRVIAEHHPGSVRLSIHPQPIGSAKFGIRLLDAPDLWTTPWHSCALRHRDGTVELLPRARAEQLGTVVWRNGRPDHVTALD